MNHDDARSTELAVQLTDAFTAWSLQQRESVAPTTITDGLAEFIVGAFVAMIQGRPLAEQETILGHWFSQVRSQLLQREP
jgi:hypothetical protein